MNRKCVPVDGNIPRRKALSLYKDDSKGSPQASDTKPFTTGKGWLHRFRDGFELKQVTGEAESADEEVTATFLTVLELIKEKGYHKLTPSAAMKLGSSGRRCPIEATFVTVQRRYQGIKHGRTDEL